MTSTKTELKVLFFIVLENIFDDQTPQWTFLGKQLTYLIFHLYCVIALLLLIVLRCSIDNLYLSPYAIYSRDLLRLS